MKPNILAIAIVAACLGTIACDDATMPTEPSSFKNELDFTPLVLPRLTWSIPHPCSTVMPVSAPVTLNVTAGHFPVTLLAEVPLPVARPVPLDSTADDFRFRIADAPVREHLDRELRGSTVPVHVSAGMPQGQRSPDIGEDH